MISERPKVKVALTTIDHVIEGIGWGLICGMFIWIIWHYAELPEQMPRHFNAQGEPDAYGRKTFIWVLPAIALAIHAGMVWLSRYPHWFNYTVDITHNNAPRLYKLGARIVRVVSTLSAALFAYIVYGSVNVALGKHEQLSPYFVLIVVASSSLLVVLSVWKMHRKEKTESTEK